jgi:oxygen-dependent protoporphyrinogen oxidase
MGKARAAMDMLLPRRQDKSDESLGDFIERRLGKEVLENIAEPLLAGIYAGDTHHLSLQATFPQFQSIEQNSRSLILGMSASRKETASNPQLPAIAKSSMFLSYRRGLSTLVERLLEVLDDVQLWNNRHVTELFKTSEGYQVSLDQGEVMQVDGVILAVPNYVAAKILNAVPAATKLNQIPYVSVANVILAFNKEDIDFSFEGSGFVIPRSEGTNITACTWTSLKWLHTAPEGKALLRCYIGRSGAEELVDSSDQELLAAVQKDLEKLMGITAKPIFYEVNRWRDSMPQYPVGHLELIKSVRDQLAQQMPGVLITGSGFRGVGIPDCIQQGKEAAKQLATLVK